MISRSIYFGVFAFALAVLAGCNTGDSEAQKSAEKLVAVMNSHDYDTAWNMVSSDSQQAVSNQLNRVRGTMMGDDMISRAFDVPLDQVSKLTPQSYFVAIMRKGQSNNPAPTKLVKVETDGNNATVTVSKGGVESKTPMVKVNGEWKMEVKMNN